MTSTRSFKAKLLFCTVFLSSVVFLYLLLTHTHLFKEDFKQNISNPGTHPFLMVIIFSKSASSSLRTACRNTWLKDYRNDADVAFRFVMGTAGLNEEENHKLQTEAEQYGDLLLLENHTESYGYECTNKLLLSFQWVAKHSKAQYVMKTDDDCYVRLGFILSLLYKRTSQTKKAFLCGTFLRNKPPPRQGKWKEEKWNLTKEYLPFPLGSGYILPVSLMKTILVSNNIVPLRKLTNEDVTVGLWVAQYDIDYIDIERHSKKKEEVACLPRHDKTVVYHCFQSSKLMYRIHSCSQAHTVTVTKYRA